MKKVHGWEGDSEFVITCMKIWQFVLFFLSFFLSVAGAGQLLNLVFSKLIASGVGLEAETCLITHSPISWH